MASPEKIPTTNIINQQKGKKIKFLMIYRLLGLVLILQQVYCCFKHKLELKELLMIPLQGLKIMKKNTKFGHPNGQLKKTKVHTPYENNWGG